MTGSKEAKYLTRTTAEGRELRLPVGIIHGARAGEQITVYGGQHGTEYAGIEAVQRLYRELDPADVRGVIELFARAGRNVLDAGGDPSVASSGLDGVCRLLQAPEVHAARECAEAWTVLLRRLTGPTRPSPAARARALPSPPTRALRFAQRPPSARRESAAGEFFAALDSVAKRFDIPPFEWDQG